MSIVCSDLVRVSTESLMRERGHNYRGAVKSTPLDQTEAVQKIFVSFAWAENSAYEWGDRLKRAFVMGDEQIAHLRVPYGGEQWEETHNSLLKRRRWPWRAVI